jgi:hypothetical protein
MARLASPPPSTSSPVSLPDFADNFKPKSTLASSGDRCHGVPHAIERDIVVEAHGADALTLSNLHIELRSIHLNKYRFAHPRPRNTVI